MKRLKITKPKWNFKELLQNYKQWVPNGLTGLRILLTPIIIVLGIIQQFPLVILFTCLAAITDCLDGRLARKWNTVSDIGAKLDAIADKVFAIGLSICLTSLSPILWGVVGLECTLAICNLVFHYKSKKTESLWIGKIKTTVLFIMVIFMLGSHFLPQLSSVATGFIYVSMNLQILCIIEYSFNFYDNMHPITVEDNRMHQSIMQEIPEETLEQKTIELEHLEELVTQYDAEESN